MGSVDCRVSLRDQCWAPARVAARWLGISEQTLNDWRRHGGIVKGFQFVRDGRRFLYCPERIQEEHEPSKAPAKASSWQVNFIGNWETVMGALARDASDRSKRVVVWVDWPKRAPMSRAALVSLLYGLGAAAVIDSTGKVWSPAK